MRIWAALSLILAIALVGCSPRPPEELMVGVASSWPPVIEVCATTGCWEGIAPDIIRMVADALDMQVTWTSGTLEHMTSQVQDGTLDVLITGVPAGRPLPDTFHSLPYFVSGQVVISRADRAVPALHELAGLDIGVMGHRAGLQVVLDLGARMDQITVESKAGRLYERLLAREVDVVITDRELGLKWQQRHPELINTSRAPFTLELYCFSLSGVNPDLLRRIDQVLDRLNRDGRQQEIENRWLPARQ